jgi:hypothetical protein
MYAVDAIVCPDGLPHEPKFSHTAAMHSALAGVAAALLDVDAQVANGVTITKDAKAYVYGAVAFIENAGKNDAQGLKLKGKIFDVPSGSSSLVDLGSGATIFNSKTITVKPATERQLTDAGTIGGWKQWAEPVRAADVKTGMYPPSALVHSAKPTEMTNLTQALTTYAFYEVKVTKAQFGDGKNFTVATSEAMAFRVFVDGKPVAEKVDTQHSTRPEPILYLNIGDLGDWPANASGEVALTLLAEEMGYANYGFVGGLEKVRVWCSLIQAVVQPFLSPFPFPSRLAPHFSALPPVSRLPSLAVSPTGSARRRHSRQWQAAAGLVGPEIGAGGRAP